MHTEPILTPTTGSISYKMAAFVACVLIVERLILHRMSTTKAGSGINEADMCMLQENCNVMYAVYVKVS